MSKLKLGALLDDKPVKLTIELPAEVSRDLIVYADLLGRQNGQTIEPAKLIAPILAKFMSTDRAFVRLRRQKQGSGHSNSTSLMPSTTAR